MADTFTTSQVDNPVEFHSGPMNFSIQKSIPNKVDGTLKFETGYTPSAAIHRGKQPIVAKTITTTDIPTSEVFADWEARNNKAITIPRQKEESSPVGIDFNIDILYGLLNSDVYVTDLEENMGISGNKVTGDLIYNETWPEYSDTPEQQSGYYIAFQINYDGDYDAIRVGYGEIIEGTPSYFVNPDENEVVVAWVNEELINYPITVYVGKIPEGGEEPEIVATRSLDISELVLKLPETE